MIKNHLDIVYTDLDGTLRHLKDGITEADINTLEFLGYMGVYRVVATGRSLYSFRKVIPNDFPIDYLIFSTGAGIIDWKKQEVIYQNHLNQANIKEIANFFIQHKLDFMIHGQIPDNHCFYYHQSNSNNSDFIKRCELYAPFAEPLNGSLKSIDKSCQLLAIFPEENHFDELAAELQQKYPEIKLVKATSPLDNKSLWMEIFPAQVSKGQSARWLSEQLNTNFDEKSLGIGNDYNDIDLLQATKHSFCVNNSPAVLKNQFEVVAEQHNNGFTQAIRKFL